MPLIRCGAKAAPKRHYKNAELHFASRAFLHLLTSAGGEERRSIWTRKTIFLADRVPTLRCLKALYENRDVYNLHVHRPGAIKITPVNATGAPSLREASTQKLLAQPILVSVEIRVYRVTSLVRIVSSRLNQRILATLRL